MLTNLHVRPARQCVNKPTPRCMNNLTRARGPSFGSSRWPTMKLLAGQVKVGRHLGASNGPTTVETPTWLDKVVQFLGWPCPLKIQE